MCDLVLASTNEGKRAEFARLLTGMPVRLCSLAAFPHVRVSADLESGETYAENAARKALAVLAQTGYPALADDSGLEVDALQGRPGVRSARYGGPDASDAQRAALLLGELAGVPLERRQARFRCVLALAWPGRGLWLVEGICPGWIALAAAGEYGFGYDPVFVPAAAGGRTMAELAPEEKNRLSHRAAAVSRLRPLLVALARGETPPGGEALPPGLDGPPAAQPPGRR